MTNLFDKETTVFLVDFETDIVINYGQIEDMLTQLNESHGNLQVISYENLTQTMKNQLSMAEMLEDAYKEEDK
jgi:hypothetical protein